MKLATKKYTYKELEIAQREGDGYLDATAMCKAHGKEFFEFERLDGVNAFLDKLSENLCRDRVLLIVKTRGRNGRTWVHPRVAIKLAQWLSQDFEVVVTGWVFDILTTGTATLKPDPRRRRYELQGKPAEFVEARLEGIPARRTFTDVLKEHGVEGNGYGVCTNAIYRPLLGGTAKELRAARRLPPSAEVRDAMNPTELAKLRLTELLAAERIAADQTSGTDPCADACSEVAEAIATASRIATRQTIPSRN